MRRVKHKEWRKKMKVKDLIKRLQAVDPEAYLMASGSICDPIEVLPLASRVYLNDWCDDWCGSEEGPLFWELYEGGDCRASMLAVFLIIRPDTIVETQLQEKYNEKSNN